MSDLAVRLRKNYPAGAHHEYKGWGSCALCGDDWPCEWSETFADVNEAADEIERMERWKREAIEVLAAWDGVHDAAGQPARLGHSTATEMAFWVVSEREKVQRMEQTLRYIEQMSDPLVARSMPDLLRHIGTTAHKALK